MTAGSGIIHQEMPERYDGMLQGFQLWVNLPKKSKMMPPRYREVPSRTIPKVRLPDNVEVKDHRWKTFGGGGTGQGHRRTG